MSLGTVQKESRKEIGLTQEAFGKRVNLSRSMVADIETGRRKMPRDVMRKAVETLDCGFYAMEAAQEVLGEVWISHLDNVDLHRSAVREKVLEELDEALKEITAVRSSDLPKSEKRGKLKEVMLESIDAIVGLTHFVAVYCKEYGLSWSDVWREHRRKLEQRGYIRKRR
jgi:transcriptional regulator with XRE-family HTH domain